MSILNADQFIISLSIAFLMFCMGTIFIIQSIRRKRRAYSLTIAVFIGMIASLIEMFRSIELGLEGIGSTLLVIHLGTWCLMYLLTLLFFAQLSGENIDSSLLSLGLIFATLHVSFGILWIFGDRMSPTLERVITIVWDFTYIALGILVFAYGAYVHFRTYKYTKEYPGIIIGLAMTFIAIGFLIGFLPDVRIGNDSLRLIGEILKIIGIFTFVIFYMIKIDYIFRLPFDINAVILFNKLGMLIYAGMYGDETIQDQEEEIPIDLITAAVNAFATFMVETTGSKESLEQVRTGDKLLIVEEGKNSSIAVICNNSSFFLVKSMKNLVHKIEQKYEKELDLDYADSTHYTDVPSIIMNTFPYLGLPKSEKY